MSRFEPPPRVEALREELRDEVRRFARLLRELRGDDVLRCVECGNVAERAEGWRARADVDEVEVRCPTCASELD